MIHGKLSGGFRSGVAAGVPPVSDLRQSRRLERGRAAQGRMALRAIIQRLSPIHPKHIFVQPPPKSILFASSFVSRVRGPTASQHRLHAPIQTQRSTHRDHSPPPTLPELSNFRSPTAEPEDFLWIKNSIHAEYPVRHAHRARRGRWQPFVFSPEPCK